MVIAVTFEANGGGGGGEGNGVDVGGVGVFGDDGGDQIIQMTEVPKGPCWWLFPCHRFPPVRSSRRPFKRPNNPI